nr:MAG TPA: hypothetical protein [Caudoviricetes sp.]
MRRSRIARRSNSSRQASLCSKARKGAAHRFVL